LRDHSVRFAVARVHGRDWFVHSKELLSLVK
jgi:hypothetical protein